jgi:hypothetical protein
MTKYLMRIINILEAQILTDLKICKVWKSAGQRLFAKITQSWRLLHTRLHVLLFCLCSTFDHRTEKINHNSGSELWSFKITVFSVHQEPCLVRLSSSILQVQIGSKTSHGVGRVFSGVCFCEKRRSAGSRFKSITLLGSLVCDKKKLVNNSYTHKAGNWSCFSCGPRRRGRYEFRESSSHNNSLWGNRVLSE